MNKVSLVLLILQVAGLVGTLMNGSFATMAIPEMIGFFIPAIIAVILIIRDKKKNK